MSKIIIETDEDLVCPLCERQIETAIKFDGTKFQCPYCQVTMTAVVEGIVKVAHYWSSDGPGRGVRHIFITKARM